MKATMEPGRALSIVLALCVLMLSGLLFWEWDQGLGLERELLKMRKIPATAVPAQKVLPEFKLPDAESGFPELVPRSLFAGNRRSMTAARKGGQSVMKKGQFMLVGVLITPKQRSALLRDVQTNKTETVALVGVVRGMTLGEVESSRVVLRQGAETEELALNVQTGPKPPNVAQAQAMAIPPPPTAPPASAPSAPVPARAASANSPASAPVPLGKPVDAASGPKPSSTLPLALSKK
nr:hypothetical protein [Rhodoferax sp.]